MRKVSMFLLVLMGVGGLFLDIFVASHPRNIDFYLRVFFGGRYRQVPC